MEGEGGGGRQDEIAGLVDLGEVLLIVWSFERLECGRSPAEIYWASLGGLYVYLSSLFFD